MGFHTFPVDRADSLEDPTRYRFCSREELLELLDPDPTDRVMDIGSGTGFYASDVAPFVGTLFAIDLQHEMHRRYLLQGIPPHTYLVTCDVAMLPFTDDTFDLAFSVDTHHEFYTESAVHELARTIRPGGRLVTIDWSSEGTGADGPPLAERFGPTEIEAQLMTAGFDITARRERPETVAIVARR